MKLETLTKYLLLHIIFLYLLTQSALVEIRIKRSVINWGLICIGFHVGGGKINKCLGLNASDLDCELSGRFCVSSRGKWLCLYYHVLFTGIIWLMSQDYVRIESFLLSSCNSSTAFLSNIFVFLHNIDIISVVPLLCNLVISIKFQSDLILTSA